MPQWDPSIPSEEDSLSPVDASSADASFLAEHSAGEVIERIDGDVAAIANFFARFAIRVLGNAVFLISRLPGLIAHAHEERTRQAPMRQIDPKDHDYDGSRERRLPEGRK